MQTSTDRQGQAPRNNKQRKFVQKMTKNSTWFILVDWTASLPA